MEVRTKTPDYAVAEFFSIAMRYTYIGYMQAYFWCVEYIHVF